ncbi:MAG: hypothetical protein GEV28_34270 [Actinophytocola sp.]|uniref:DUF6002 family protein n=1 Tax=Actinophytocola sp. TaxID=1872138 RepID=UPI001327746E|nr:DUF6002 family protein [Actinophytocola sp.]MPZ85181.1 hypothetical protein [Actinophytocola sp.]
MTVSWGQRTVNAVEFYDELRRATAVIGTSHAAGADFEPEFDLPELTPELTDFFSVANLRFADLGTAGRSRLALLDLTGNPGTRTVKTLASLVIVARAVRHINRTGERVMILTPSSANKATALRDAVLRAYRAGLVDPGQLQVVTIVPDVARPKLWSSALDQDGELAALNPMCVLDRAQPAHVKEIAKDALRACAKELFLTTGVRLWHTMDIANYQCADTVRAFAEHTIAPPAHGTTRTHAHSVSSAFGLLGHHFGTTLLPGTAARPQYFLVQHLATADMVLSLHEMDPPVYRADPESGLYHQDATPRYPRTTFDPAEDLESTFYTRSPATSPAMNRIIRTQGGGGIVVSLHECLTRYAQIRVLLANAGVTLPADPRALREWSLVMAMTGVLNGIDRGLLDTDEVIVHGSGSYDATEFAPIPHRSLCAVADATDLQRIIAEAAMPASAVADAA